MCLSFFFFLAWRLFWTVRIQRKVGNSLSSKTQSENGKHWTMRKHWTQLQTEKWEQRYIQRMERGWKEEIKSSQGILKGKWWVKEFWSFLKVLQANWIRKGHGWEIGKLSWSKRQVSPFLAVSGEKRSYLLEIALLLFYFIFCKHHPFFSSQSCNRRIQINGWYNN